MENRVETGVLEVDMGLQGHIVIPGSITAHLETGILDLHHLGVFHATWKPVNWK
jgi:hypothetical protein